MSVDIPNNVEQWHRRLCQVTDWLYISGDLSPQSSERHEQLEQWRAAGITDIVDVREEWSDEKIVRQSAPEIRYWHLGTHDNGGTQDLDWFLAGLKPLEVTRENDGKVLVHCHMGINRGPSMAFFYLLRAGWAPAPALDAIRAARAIAAISYAKDAARANALFNGYELARRLTEATLIESWFEANDIDVARIIHRLRKNP